MRFWCTLLGLWALCSLSHAALFAVDVGTDFMKVSLIKPGMVPISVVVNEISKRKSRSTVAVVEGDRYLSEEAFSLGKRHPQVVFQRLRDFLGKPAEHEDTQKVLRRGTGHSYPLKVVEDEERGTVRFSTGGDQTVSVEELMGSLLHYAKGITAAQAGEEVLDCVIAVPAFFGPPQKQALLDSARLAGLNVMALVHSHAAAALQYGIERDFANKTDDIILYDMGSNSIQVALVSYSSYPSKERGKKKIVSQFQVKDVTWDDNLGGDTLDWLLVDHFASQFQEKHKQDITGSPRAMAKLKDAVRKTKEVLSANMQAPLYIDALHSDIDFTSSITREQFEALAGEFFELAKKPLLEIVERNNVDVANLASVEWLGGGTRVPKLESELSKALGGRTLDRHLDADEAVVMGAGLVAANLSTTFRLRKFGLVDAVLYPMSMKIEEPEGLVASVGKEEAASILKDRPILPYLKSIPGARVVNLPNFTADPFSFTLSFNKSNPNGLPAGVDSELFASYNVSGTRAAIEEYGAGGKVKLSFKADMVGLLYLEKAEYWIDVVVKPSKPSNSTNTTSTESDNSATLPDESIDAKAGEGDTATADSEEGAQAENSDEKGTDDQTGEELGDSEKDTEGDADVEEEKEKEKSFQGNKKEKKSKKKKQPKMKLVKVPLEVEGPSFAHKVLGKAAMTKSKKVLSNFKKREREKMEREKAKNDLESYIYSMKEKLDGNEAVEKVTTEEQRTEFGSELTEMEDWLYMEGQDEPTKEFRKRLSALRETGDAIEVRAAEASDRPKTVVAARAYVELIQKSINSWPEMKPFLNQTEVDMLSQKNDEFEEWLNEMEKKQEALPLHEKPAYMSNDILIKMTTLDKQFKKLNKKRPPKPKPTPPQGDKAKPDTTGDTGKEESGDSDQGKVQDEKSDSSETDASEESIIHEEL